MDGRKSRTVRRSPAASTRRESDLFNFYSDLAYTEGRFHQYIRRYKYSRREISLIQKALEFAKLVHNGQQRVEGGFYVLHPIRVANILLHELSQMSSDMVCAALLHDVIEKSGISTRELKNNFNENVSHMVRQLSVDPKVENSKAVYVQQIANAGDGVRMIKLCDRLDNLRALRYQDNKTRIRRYTLETEKKYLPMAEKTALYLFREMRGEIHHAKAKLKK